MGLRFPATGFSWLGVGYCLITRCSDAAATTVPKNLWRSAASLRH
ncbi:hypothetical protein I552_3951 [Mycobacterium xenopi 3993]|nr:hypothetical protein I552_3951 [Mycobacterium xenopi 3993]